jgi:hypothetical protein
VVFYLRFSLFQMLSRYRLEGILDSFGYSWIARSMRQYGEAEHAPIWRLGADGSDDIYEISFGGAGKGIYTSPW